MGETVVAIIVSVVLIGVNLATIVYLLSLKDKENHLESEETI